VAAEPLGEITGESATEETMNAILSRIRLAK
jgi:hypothetical protein